MHTLNYCVALTRKKNCLDVQLTSCKKSGRKQSVTKLCGILTGTLKLLKHTSIPIKRYYNLPVKSRRV